MIRHIFMGSTNKGVTEEEINALLEAWNALPGKIPVVINLTAGRNLGLVNKEISLALVADFKNEKDWESYMEHPDHVKVGQRLTSKIIDPSSRTIVQIKI